MGDLLHTGLTWLAGQLREHASRQISYVRGAASVTLRATVARTQGTAITAAGAAVTTEARNYLIAVADLTLRPPQAGDRIVDPLDGTFEVLPTEQGRAYDWVGERHVLYRVHTKQVG